MTTTKEYRTELRAAMQGMDGAEKLRAITALREFAAFTSGEPDTVSILGHARHHIHKASTLGQVARLLSFLGRMLPLHLGADRADEVEATLDAMEDMLQEDHDRRRAARGATS